MPRAKGAARLLRGLLGEHGLLGLDALGDLHERQVDGHGDDDLEDLPDRGADVAAYGPAKTGQPASFTSREGAWTRSGW